MNKGEIPSKGRTLKEKRWLRLWTGWIMDLKWQCFWTFSSVPVSSCTDLTLWAATDLTQKRHCTMEHCIGVCKEFFWSWWESPQHSVIFFSLCHHWQNFKCSKGGNKNCRRNRLPVHEQERTNWPELIFQTDNSVFWLHSVLEPFVDWN